MRPGRDYQHRGGNRRNRRAGGRQGTRQFGGIARRPYQPSPRTPRSNARNISGRNRNPRINRSTTSAPRGSITGRSDTQGSDLRLPNLDLIDSYRTLLPGYDLYYCDSFPTLHDFGDKVGAVVSFLNRADFLGDNSAHECDEDDVYFQLQVNAITSDEEFNQAWPLFETELRNQPDDVINLWSASAHKVIQEAVELQHMQSSNTTIPQPKSPKVIIGLALEGPVTPIADLRASYLGQYLLVYGNVVKCSNMRPHVERMTFGCKLCGHEFPVDQHQSHFTMPEKCKGLNCNNTKQGLFEMLDEAPTSVSVDARLIQVQDIEQNEEANPRTMECLLKGNLATISPNGDVVQLCGILRLKKAITKSATITLHDMILDVTCLTLVNEDKKLLAHQAFSFTDMDLRAIEEIQRDENIFRRLVHSLAPGICGNEVVKAGLLLALLGGTSRDDDTFGKRSDINVLLCGEPGLAKSSLLKRINKVAPISVFVTATSSSTCGLSVTLVKDSNNYSLEYGALILADRGILIVDELEKMSGQHNVLLEAMEQKTVSIAKGGICRTFLARTSVLAASNPAGGHYDICKTATENLKISPALMSRFDLLYIMLDEFNEKQDRILINHFRRTTSDPQASYLASSATTPTCNDNESIMALLKVSRNDAVEMIPTEILQKYIAYARQNCKPTLSSEAKKVLKDYFMQLRESHQHVNDVPITTRHLESLQRLAQARAKVDLSDQVTMEHAKQVTEIYTNCQKRNVPGDAAILSATSSGISSMPFNRTKKASTTTEARKLLKALTNVAKRQCKTIFSVDEMKTMSMILQVSSTVYQLIDVLNNNGVLIKKSAKTYQLLNVDI